MRVLVLACTGNGANKRTMTAARIGRCRRPSGDKLELGILRNGSPMTVNVTVGEFHNGKEVASNDGQASPKGGKLGLAVEDLNSDVRQQLRLPEDVKGVAIEQVRPGELHLALFGELADRVKKDRHAQGFGLGINVHGTGVGRMKILVCRREGDAAEAQFFFGQAQLGNSRPLRGVDSGKSNQFLRIAFDVIGYTLVPEPASISVLGFVGIAILSRRRRIRA